MNRKIVLALVLCGLLAQGRAPAQTQATRKSLDRETAIQGYPCAKGFAWFFADGRLYRCTVAREVPFGEATIPAGSIIALTPDGKPKFVQMSRTTTIRGYRCQGGSLLGPGEGSMVAFYPSGKLRELFLAEDQTVDGVPCAHSGLVTTTLKGDPSVLFSEDGRLQSCRLSRAFEGQKKGDRYARKAK
jgi:hypothetical protein